MSNNRINSDRILSIDVFRGLTMALMVLVNSLGTRSSYPILMHAPWNGCSLADLVFPAFLFIVGMTTVISLKKHRHEESKAQLYRSILKRTVLLFLLGIFLNAFPSHFDMSTIRIFGILQRIAVCYFICAILYLHTSVRTQLSIFLGILLTYWYFLTQIPMPGHGVDQLEMTRNWVVYIDKLIVSPGHLLGKFDPEGLFGTIPSIATTLVGLIMGSFLLGPPKKSTPSHHHLELIYSTNYRKCIFMIFIGFIFLIVAWIWSYSFPINKNLWTSTFVLWTGGISLIAFGTCYYIIDLLGYKKWSFPFKVLGMNALFIFIFHVILLKIQSLFVLTLPNGSKDVLRVYIAENLFGSFSQQNAGLFYALLFLLLNFLVALFLYWRKIFIKI